MTSWPPNPLPPITWPTKTSFMASRALACRYKRSEIWATLASITPHSPVCCVHGDLQRVSPTTKFLSSLQVDLLPSYPRPQPPFRTSVVLRHSPEAHHGRRGRDRREFSLLRHSPRLRPSRTSF